MVNFPTYDTITIIKLFTLKRDSNTREKLIWKESET